MGHKVQGRGQLVLASDKGLAQGAGESEGETTKPAVSEEEFLTANAIVTSCQCQVH